MFHMDDITGDVPPTSDEFQDLHPKQEKLLWHYKLGHVPFSTINRLAALGDIPKRIAKAAEPMCSACMYGQMASLP
jgi:hypothetical protein